MQCKIISLRQNQNFQGISSVVLPAVRGETQILSGHAESFLELREGEIIMNGKERKSLPISNGVCHIKGDKVLIIL